MGTLTSLSIAANISNPLTVSTTYNAAGSTVIQAYASYIGTNNDSQIAVGVSGTDCGYFGYSYVGGTGASSNFAFIGIHSDANVSHAFSAYSDHCIVNLTGDASSATSGSLQVAGGASISKSLYVAGNISVTSTTNSTSSVTGALQIAGGAGIAGSLYVGGTIYQNNAAIATQSYVTGSFQPLNSHLTTISSLTQSSGSFVTSSGTDYQFSTPAQVSTILGLGTLATLNSVDLSSKVSGTLTNASLPSAISISTLSLTSTTNSSSNSTGALLVSGGIGLAGSLYVGTNLNVGGTTNLIGTTTVGTLISTSTTNSTSSVTGALQVAGGTGIAGSLYVGGTIYQNNAAIATQSYVTGSFQPLNGTFDHD